LSRRQAEWLAILQSVIEKSEIGQSLISEFITLPRMRTPGFGLWSASGESGAAGGEQRLVERSRSATPPPTTDGSPPLVAAICQCPLVTSAFFAKRNRRGHRENGATVKPVKRSKNCVGHGGIIVSMSRSREILFNPGPSLSWTGACIFDRHKNCMAFVTMKM
jgi:hypothetical protein